jgi:two-component system sensor histidine kinase DctS
MSFAILYITAKALTSIDKETGQFGIGGCNVGRGGVDVLYRLKINWKIVILSFGIVLYALSIGGTILIGRLFQLREDELGQRLLTTSRTVAKLPSIVEAMSGSDTAEKRSIDRVVEQIRIINDADYIVVMDMDGIRWSHPLAALIGTPSNGADERSAFAEHTYISKAKGEIGASLRAFVPMMNDQHEQVGVVLTGHLLPSIGRTLADMRGQIYITVALSLLFGIWGSWLLASHIKRQMFELEPHEIARLLTERTAAFQAMHEGVIAIDSKEQITIFNERAKQMLGIAGDVIGRKVREVVPESRLPDIMYDGEASFNQEMQIGSVMIMSSRIPINVGAETIGAVAIFQDRTEVTHIAEELTGVKAFVDALRVQNHEYINKLHTIGGLIQLDLKEKALEYVFQVKEQREELTQWIGSRIKNGNLAGLLLGKISRGKELGIDVTIDSQSRLHRFPVYLDHHDFVVLIGNLIENAFDAQRRQETDKQLFISLEQDEEVCSVLVEDNGPGISPEVRERMFERGYSTKEGASRGLGLYLIKSIVDKGGGRIQVDSEQGRGASIMITLPMNKRGNDA